MATAPPPVEETPEMPNASKQESSDPYKVTPFDNQTSKPFVAPSNGPSNQNVASNGNKYSDVGSKLSVVTSSSNMYSDVGKESGVKSDGLLQTSVRSGYDTYEMQELQQKKKNNKSNNKSK